MPRPTPCPAPVTMVTCPSRTPIPTLFAITGQSKRLHELQSAARCPRFRPREAGGTVARSYRDGSALGCPVARGSPRGEPTVSPGGRFEDHGARSVRALISRPVTTAARWVDELADPGGLADHVRADMSVCAGAVGRSLERSLCAGSGTRVRRVSSLYLPGKSLRRARGTPLSASRQLTRHGLVG
jgi:hypothetical protein